MCGPGWRHEPTVSAPQIKQLIIIPSCLTPAWVFFYNFNGSYCKETPPRLVPVMGLHHIQLKLEMLGVSFFYSALALVSDVEFLAENNQVQVLSIIKSFCTFLEVSGVNSYSCCSFIKMLGIYRQFICIFFEVLGVITKIGESSGKCQLLSVTASPSMEFTQDPPPSPTGTLSSIKVYNQKASPPEPRL